MHNDPHWAEATIQMLHQFKPSIDGVTCTRWWRGGAGSSESTPRGTTPTYPASAASGEKSPRRRGRGQSAKPDQMAGPTQFPARRRGAPEHTHFTPTHTITQPCWWGGSPVGGEGKGRSASPGRPFSPQAELSSKSRWGYTTTAKIPRADLIVIYLLWFIHLKIFCYS